MGTSAGAGRDAHSATDALSGPTTREMRLSRRVTNNETSFMAMAD
jgi:hypothetical protein